MMIGNAGKTTLTIFERSMADKKGNLHISLREVLEALSVSWAATW